MGRFTNAFVWTALVFLLVPSHPVLAAENQIDGMETADYASGWGYGLEIRASFNFLTGQIMEPISDVPVFIRQVPIRFNDSQAGKILTIPDSTLDPGTYSSGNISIAPEIKFRRMLFRGGVNFELPISPRRHHGSSGSTRELNQRGPAAIRLPEDTLVYYAVETTVRGMPGLFGEVEVSLTKNLSLLGGYAISPYKVRFISGWDLVGEIDFEDEEDRQEDDEFETYRKYPLSNNSFRALYGGLRIYSHNRAVSFVVLGGRVTHSVNPTALGTDVGITYGLPSMMFRAGVSFHWNW